MLIDVTKETFVVSLVYPIVYFELAIYNVILLCTAHTISQDPDFKFLGSDSGFSPDPAL